MTELLIINPNTSTDVTANIDRLAREELGPRVAVRAVTAAFGARYIASRAGVAIAGHAVLDAYASALAEGAKPDAVVLACFGDPGFDALREVCAVPVLAFADTGLTEAAAAPGRFAIATIGAIWGEMLAELVQRRGLGDRLATIMALDHDSRDADVAARNIAAGAAASGASRVIVGGTGLIPIMDEITRALPMPVIDPHRLTLRAAAGAPSGPRGPAQQDSDFVGITPALHDLLRRMPTLSVSS